VGAGHALPTYITPRIELSLLDPEQERPLRRWALQRRMDWTSENGWRELSDTRSLALLHQAWRESRDSGYELFRFFCRPARAEAFDCE